MTTYIILKYISILKSGGRVQYGKMAGVLVVVFRV